LFERAFADAKAQADFIGSALVVEVQSATGRLESFDDLLGQWSDALIARCIESQVDLAIGANFAHESFSALTDDHRRGKFAAVEQSQVRVINNCGVSQRTLAHHQQSHSIARGIASRFFVDMIDNPCARNHAIGVGIDAHDHDHSIARIERFRLLGIWQQEILGESPIEKRTHARMHMFYGEKSKLPQHRIGLLGGCHKTIFRVAIEKNIKRSIHLDIAGHISTGQKNFAQIAAVEIEPRLCFACDIQKISLANFRHDQRVGERSVSRRLSPEMRRDLASAGGKTPSSPLPVRDGVGASCTVLSEGPWKTILESLCARFPAIAQAEWRRRMVGGEVVDEFGKRVSESRLHTANLRVFYYRSVDDEPRIPFDEVVLFQDEHLVVADKPHFLPVTPAGRFVRETLLARLKKRLGIDTLVPIHRIDRGTAGVVLFSTQANERDAYQSLFRSRRVVKSYESIGAFNPTLILPTTYESRLVADSHFTRMAEEAGEANSTTHIQLIEVRGKCAHYRLSPVTGRKHQLRVHCAALGIAICNDPIYPVLQPEPNADVPEDFSRPLQLLARHVEFVDPITSKLCRFESQFRLDWQAAVQLP